MHSRLIHLHHQHRIGIPCCKRFNKVLKSSTIELVIDLKKVLYRQRLDHTIEPKRRSPPLVEALGLDTGQRHPPSREQPPATLVLTQVAQPLVETDDRWQDLEEKEFF